MSVITATARGLLARLNDDSADEDTFNGEFGSI
jgi:hypothetical protein